MDPSRAMELRTLEVYVSVCDTRSMVASGERLGISQAAVSQAIARLEASLGAQLLDRSVRPMRLTAAGALLRDRARLLLASARQTMLAVQGLGASQVPELRMALVNSLAGAVMPDFYDLLRAELKIEKLSLLSGLARSNIQALVEGDVEVAITSDMVEEGIGLPSIALLREPFVVVAPKRAPRTERLADMAASLPFIGFSSTCILGRLLRLQIARLRLDLPETTGFDSSLCLMDVVAAGRGWTIATPLCLLEGRADPAAVSVRPIREAMSPRRISLLTREHELGDLPRRLADIAARTAHAVLPRRLAPYGAWILDEVVVLPDSEGAASLSAG